MDCQEDLDGKEEPSPDESDDEDDEGDREDEEGEKPQVTFPQLIRDAFSTKARQYLSLAEIYASIEERHPFYRYVIVIVIF